MARLWVVDHGSVRFYIAQPMILLPWLLFIKHTHYPGFNTL